MSLDRTTLLGFLHDRLGVDQGSIDDATSLFSSGVLDSFGMVELIMFLENVGGVQLRPTEVTLENLDSVERIMGFLAVRAQEE